MSLQTDKKTATYNEMKSALADIFAHIHDYTYKKGVYIYGNAGIGKTTFVMQSLQSMGYDPVLYDMSDMRSKSTIETLVQNKQATCNIIDTFHGRIRPIVIVMDEIDGMNRGDKGGINALIKILRPKKNLLKKELTTDIPFVCIGSHYTDKKIRELIKACVPIAFSEPARDVMSANILDCIARHGLTLSRTTVANILAAVGTDLRKYNALMLWIGECVRSERRERGEYILSAIYDSLIVKKTDNCNTQNVVLKLFKQPHLISDHTSLLGETDRIIAGMLFHENVINVAGLTLETYVEILRKITFADTIDSIVFNKQIVVLSELSSLLKTFNNMYLLHSNKKYDGDITMRYTKILTKYSTEYNNNLFLQRLCQFYLVSKAELLGMFDVRGIPVSLAIKQHPELEKKDVERIYRFLKYLLGIIVRQPAMDADVEVEDDSSGVE